MMQSPSISALAKALVAAQKDIKSVTKDSLNPHFKNRYASLDILTEEVRPILNSHGIALIQGGDENTGVVETMLLHESGEWLMSKVVMPLDKQSPQGAGSAITYGRRYGLSALLALTTDDDDDAEGAEAPIRAGGLSVPAEARAVGFTSKAPPCPMCSSDMYDNRVSKKNPKGPDFKCKDPKCAHPIWLDDKKGATGGTVIRTANLKEDLRRTSALYEDMEQPTPPDDDNPLPF